MQALDGITVLDFTTLLPGPLATLMLAEAGARVIKIERPGGEDMRRFPPFRGEGAAAVSIPWLLLNRGKTIREIDLKDPAARGELDALIAGADVLVEQFRPGVMDRLGLGYESVRALNPRLVYCSISGYGQTGPRALEAGHDINYQALTGILALSPGAAGNPTVTPTQTADIGGGTLPAVINILLALIRRGRTGQGAHLDIAMADGLFAFAGFALAEAEASGLAPPPGGDLLTGGRSRYGLYATADDRLVAVGALEEKFWQAFCDAIALPPAYRDDAATPEATRAAVAERLRARPAAAWHPILAAADCCATLVAPLHEALADPHFQARGLFNGRVEVPGGGELTAIPVPIARGLR
ncbi:CaiB/BaiF CoA transferase family protein [Prosthecomicrobium hirschii]|uniref:CaiB/BaiF CoA transferase family protein n=1 Tax=Prosthecodimorpha hirschii TaxID=665126 RepID=UPI00221FE340|nr:CoA transferase [Prosthecomicrobium hirschii]MCW1839773.1 CoA transferase [Prosthecomicrobium hirschii]